MSVDIWLITETYDVSWHSKRTNYLWLLPCLLLRL